MTTTIQEQPLDLEKLQEFVFRAVDEVGATLNAALVVMGDRLGLYRALAGAGPLTPAELARRTGTAERYVREWLNAQAAGGYVEYEADSGRYSLPRGAGRRALRRVEPGIPARLLPDRARFRDRLAADHRGGAERGRDRLGRPRPRRSRGLRAVLPPELQRAPGLRVAARHSTASSRSSSAVPPSPTSGAATAPRQS